MKRVLILVDIQNDFIPGGALAVRDGLKVVPVANSLSNQKRKFFDLVVATQDWHPPQHGSFASSHAGKKVGDLGELGGVPQVFWPDHCVQGSVGAQFVDSLDLSKVDRVFQKGTDLSIDSYSGFFDGAHKKSTGLGDYLKNEKVTDVYILGLATDYCVKYTALDALDLGFHVWVVEDGSKGVDLVSGDVERAMEEMRRKGIRLIQSQACIG